MIFWVFILISVLFYIFNPFESHSSFPPRGKFFDYKEMKKQEKKIDDIIKKLHRYM